MKAKSQDRKVVWVVANSHPRFRLTVLLRWKMGDSNEGLPAFFKGGEIKIKRHESYCFRSVPLFDSKGK